MADIFWLSDTQWASIEPSLSHLDGKHVWMTDRLPAEFSTRFEKGYVDVGCRTNTDPEQRCSIGGANVDYGKIYTQLWQRSVSRLC